MSVVTVIIVSLCGLTVLLLLARRARRRDEVRARLNGLVVHGQRTVRPLPKDGEHCAERDDKRLQSVAEIQKRLDREAEWPRQMPRPYPRVRRPMREGKPVSRSNAYVPTEALPGVMPLRDRVTNGGRSGERASNPRGAPPASRRINPRRLTLPAVTDEGQAAAALLPTPTPTGPPHATSNLGSVR